VVAPAECTRLNVSNTRRTEVEFGCTDTTARGGRPPAGSRQHETGGGSVAEETPCARSSKSSLRALNSAACRVATSCLLILRAWCCEPKLCCASGEA
jgi:hypothetical protein